VDEGMIMKPDDLQPWEEESMKAESNPLIALAIVLMTLWGFCCGAGFCWIALKLL
jgi:hypothetical protein